MQLCQFWKTEIHTEHKRTKRAFGEGQDARTIHVSYGHCGQSLRVPAAEETGAVRRGEQPHLPMQGPHIQQSAPIPSAHPIRAQAQHAERP